MPERVLHARKKENLIRNLAVKPNTKKASILTESYRIVGKQLERKTRKTRRTFARRAVRYGLVCVNVALLFAVVLFVFKNPHSSSALKSQALNQQSNDSLASNPLDELSSADIAVQVAQLTRLPEATSVKNNADSQNEQLNVVASGTQTVAKPQIVQTALKSKKDIKAYVVKNGDTISSIAAAFGVTSDSIRWSNNLTGDSVGAGTTIFVPPVSGIAYVVKSGDTVDTVAQKYRASKEQLIADNDAEVSGLKVGERILIRDGSVPAPIAAPSYGGFAWGGSSAVYSGNGYDYGWCTWYVAVRRAELGRPVPSNLGNAYSWYRLAQRAGLPTGLTPEVGAVAVNEGGNHVAVVEVVNADGSFIVSEMNSFGYRSIDTVGDPANAYGGWNRKDFKQIGSVGNLKFIY